MSQSAFVTQANGICAATVQQVKAGATSAFTVTTNGRQDPTLIADYAGTVVLPALQREYDEIHALKPVDATGPNQILGVLEDAIDHWEIDKTIMSQVNDTTFARFDSLANDFGITTCATVDGVVRGITAGEPLPST